jgi:hypothetical protein
MSSRFIAGCDSNYSGKKIIFKLFSELFLSSICSAMTLQQIGNHVFVTFKGNSVTLKKASFSNSIIGKGPRFLCNVILFQLL